MEETVEREVKTSTFGALVPAIETNNGTKFLVGMASSAIKKEVPIYPLMEEMRERQIRMSICGQPELTTLTSTGEKSL